MTLLIIDAFLPVVPTQALMITSGALTVYGALDLPVTIAVGTAGVFIGDLSCYLLGRHGRTRPPQSTHDRRFARISRLTRGLREPGPLVIMLCRFVPGGRLAAFYHAGRRRYPLRLLLIYELTAALAWAVYGGLVGALGGNALVNSAWRLFAVAATAAAIFGSAGWLLALTGASRAMTEPAIGTTDEPTGKPVVGMTDRPISGVGPRAKRPRRRVINDIHRVRIIHVVPGPDAASLTGVASITAPVSGGLTRARAASTDAPPQ
jgi:membrane protein DedA with SNARE-associated domain